MFFNALEHMYMLCSVFMKTHMFRSIFLACSIVTKLLLSLYSSLLMDIRLWTRSLTKMNRVHKDVSSSSRSDCLCCSSCSRCGFFFSAVRFSDNATGLGTRMIFCAGMQLVNEAHMNGFHMVAAVLLHPTTRQDNC